MRCDWLSIFFRPLPEERTIAWTNGRITIAGRQVTRCLTDETVGQLRPSHGGAILSLTGAFWRGLDAPAILMGESREDDANALQRYLAETLSPEVVSLARADWATECITHQEQHDNILAVLKSDASDIASRWPNPWTSKVIDSADGITIYIGSARAKEMRSAALLARVYHRYGSGTIRREIEVKSIPGDTAQAQYNYSRNIAAYLLGWNGDLPPSTNLGDLPSKRKVPDRELAARLIGSVYNRVYHRAGCTTPREAIDWAERTCRLLGVPTTLAYEKILPTAETT